MSQSVSPVPELSRLHFRVGWAFVLVFLSMGLFLESMHGFKIGWYNDVSNATRREMFTLAHAHGTLLGLIHIAFAATLAALPGVAERSKTASRLLLAGGILLPLGFLFGGFYIYGGDPGLGILLVPPGGLALMGAAALTLRAALSNDSPDLPLGKSAPSKQRRRKS